MDGQFSDDAMMHVTCQCIPCASPLARTARFRCQSSLTPPSQIRPKISPTSTLYSLHHQVSATAEPGLGLILRNRTRYLF
ncbi:hypothetical protein ACN47E_004107 [Coniothyrium glycines]